jgi:hypothetical protein
VRSRRIRTLEVLHYLGVEEEGLLAQLREEGLFESDELEPEEADELRLAALLMEELGVNAAGVEVALHLRRRLFALEERTRALAEALDPKRRR